MENLTSIIEAILFVSGDPVRVDALAHAMNLTVSEMEEALSGLGDHLALENRGIQLNRSGETVFLSICPKYAKQVEDFLQPLQKQPLSQAVLETLSIIAYRQPVTKGDIEGVRGVKCDYSVQSLLNKGFIEEQGRRETLGRPILYGTTDKFLQHFGMQTLAEQKPQHQRAIYQKSKPQHRAAGCNIICLLHHSSSRQTAWQAIPCSAPVKPRCSSVVAFTLTRLTSSFSAPAMLLFIDSI